MIAVSLHIFVTFVLLIYYHVPLQFSPFLSSAGFIKKFSVFLFLPATFWEAIDSILLVTTVKIFKYIRPYFLKKLFLFVYFWRCQVFVAACGLSLVVADRGYSSLQCAGFSLRWLLLLPSTGSRHTGLSSCGTWAQQLWCTSLVASRHVGSSRTKARTRVPCTGRRTPNHCAPREVSSLCFFLTSLLEYNCFTMVC